MAEQPAVTLQIDMALHAQIFDALQKTKVTFVFGARRLMSLRSVQIVEVMQFLYRWHPEIGMRLELPIEPRGSGFLRPNAQEIGACLTRAAILLMSVAVMDIPAIAVATTAVAGFKWPGQTHRSIFSIRNLKSKPGVRVLRYASQS